MKKNQTMNKEQVIKFISQGAESIALLSVMLKSIEENYSKDEYLIFRKKIGSIIAEINLEVIYPMYNDFPELMPNYMK